MGNGSIIYIKLLVQCALLLMDHVNTVIGQTYNPGPYMGTQCEGVFANISFTLYDTDTYSYLIDKTVNETINLLYTESIWMQQSCVSSFRKHTCMLTLSNITTTQYLMGFGTPYLYCKSDCEYLGVGCDGYTSILSVCTYLSSFTF